jgi:hypothetical protein
MCHVPCGNGNEWGAGIWDLGVGVGVDLSRGGGAHKGNKQAALVVLLGAFSAHPVCRPVCHISAAAASAYLLFSLD